MSGLRVSEPRTLLIVWHSRTGTARQLARAAELGALAGLREAGGEDGGHVGHAGAAGVTASSQGSCRVRRVPAARAAAADLLAAAAYLFVAPENLAALSGTMKEFFDRTYYDVLDRINGRPYGLIVAAGSDGHGAVRQVERIANGWRLRAVAAPLIVVTGAQTAAAIRAPKRVGPVEQARAGEFGATLAGGLALGIF